MIFQEEFSGYVIIKCEKCGTGHKINRSYYKRYGDEYHFNPPMSCCGETAKIIYKAKSPVPHEMHEPDPVKCPSCGSTQITANHKGFGAGNAAVGGILFDWVGLLGGLIGSNQIIVTCLKCGRQWDAGKYR